MPQDLGLKSQEDNHQMRTDIMLLWSDNHSSNLPQALNISFDIVPVQSFFKKNHVVPRSVHEISDSINRLPRGNGDWKNYILLCFSLATANPG